MLSWHVELAWDEARICLGRKVSSGMLSGLERCLHRLLASSMMLSGLVLTPTDLPAGVIYNLRCAAHLQSGCWHCHSSKAGQRGGRRIWWDA